MLWERARNVVVGLEWMRLDRGAKIDKDGMYKEI